jgi:D-glucosaminate PTS system EIID component
MMGALSANYVKLTTPMTITTSVKVLQIQTFIDQIAPKLLPLVAVLGVYLYLIKIGPNYVKIVGFLIGISLLGSAIGIF